MFLNRQDACSTRVEFSCGVGLRARPGLLTRVQDVTVAKFNASCRQAILDFRFWIFDFGTKLSQEYLHLAPCS